MTRLRKQKGFNYDSLFFFPVVIPAPKLILKLKIQSYILPTKSISWKSRDFKAVVLKLSSVVVSQSGMPVPVASAALGGGWQGRIWCLIPDLLNQNLSFMNILVIVCTIKFEKCNSRESS